MSSAYLLIKTGFPLWYPSEAQERCHRSVLRGDSKEPAGYFDMKVEKGNKVKIEYEGKLDNGDVFDSSEKHGQDLEFTIGQGRVIPGFENAVLGMEKGQEKEVKIEAKDAYGEKRPELTQKIPKSQLPEDVQEKVQAGMVLGMQTPQGQQVPVNVLEVSDSEITLDMNHPLAGKNLNFKIKVIDIGEGEDSKDDDSKDDCSKDGCGCCSC